MLKLVACLCLVSVVLARSAPSVNTQAESSARSSLGAGSSLFNDMKYVYNLYQGCASQDLLVCLKVKMLTTMDRVSRSVQDIAVSDNLKIVTERKDVEEIAAEQPVALTEEAVEQSLPRSLQAQDQVLNSMLLKKFMSMINKYSFQVSV